MQYLKGEIRQRILVAAVEEFKTYGYSDAAIRNIANNAEISLGNIYRYFTNKEALYFAIINPFIDSIDELIDSELFLQGRSMGEVADILMGFVVDNANELMIIRKGNTVHQTRFIEHIVQAISSKIHFLLTNAFPEIDSKISNEDFSDAIAESFLIAMFKILRTDAPADVQARNIREIITFFFGQLSYRFKNFENDNHQS